MSVSPSFVIAFAGLVNAGKSSLFNAMIKRQQSITHEVAGTSRDYNEATLTTEDATALIIDTPGWAPVNKTTGELEQHLSEISFAQAKRADLILFVYDGSAPISSETLRLSRLLQRLNKPVLLIANKCDSPGAKSMLHEAYQLGFGPALAVSALHRHGFYTMFCEIDAALSDLKAQATTKQANETSSPNEAQPKSEQTDEQDISNLSLAIVGRPNSGKSTLINCLVGYNRMLTGPTPGLTRDAVSTQKQLGKHYWHISDTAGLRRRSKTTWDLDQLSSSSSIKALDRASLVALVIDVSVGPTKQDAILISRCVKKEKGLLVIANKSDLLSKEQQRECAETRLYGWIDQIAGVSGIPLLMISALTSTGIEQTITKLDRVCQNWQKKISTGQLNRWLQHAQDNHAMPRSKTRQPRLKYITQCASSPPRFMLFKSVAAPIPQSYQYYLGNHLRKTFSLDGVPVTFVFRERKNPYA